MGSIWRAEKPRNDVDRIFRYAPGTPERDHLVQQLNALKGQTEEIPLSIAGRAVQTDAIFEVRCPHNHQRIMARAYLAREQELRWAIDAALDAQETWAGFDWYQRAAIFYRAADLLAGPRRLEHIAAIMVNQSKTPYEAEIDLAELVDFWRFNAFYMQFLYAQQPDQAPGELNRFDWRPLEGFVLAIPPFNFYSIGGNLVHSHATFCASGVKSAQW
jgi:1-pyrroline-5-carboxylate dehydrogenase